MQTFEFHFNPKAKKDLIFDSFCYEPENVYEKKLGSLYMVGLLKNALPQNAGFLEKLAKNIKENFYKTLANGPEKSLRESLRKTNDFLEKSARNGDVSWLGNLNFGVVSIKNLELNFTKVGSLKIFLLRKGQIIDTDEKVKLDDIEPYPLKIFGNIISGKLQDQDAVLVLTEEVHGLFKTAGIFNEIAKIAPFGPKSLKQILDGRNIDLSRTFGLCLLISLTQEAAGAEKESFKKSRVFSLKDALKPLLKVLKLPRFSFKKPSLKLPKLKIPGIKIPSLNWPSLPDKRKTNIILLFALILALGFFIFRGLEQKELKAYKEQLGQIQEIVNQADIYLLIAKNNSQAEGKAAGFLAEAWDKINPLIDLLANFPSDFSKDVLNLENDISAKLSRISKLKTVEDIQPVYEFKAQDFIPQKMIPFSGNIYFFSPYGENIFELNEKNEGKILSESKRFNAATLFSNSILLFSKPDQLTLLKNGAFQDLGFLGGLPYSDFNFKDFASYQGNLYFLEIQKGEIIKYPYLGGNQWGKPQNWLASSINDKSATDFRSMAVDGSTWILNKDNSIEKYYAGILEDTFKLNIFPRPKDFTKIFTSAQLAHLYLLEPSQKRIVVLDKTTGQVVLQLQSEKFDSLLDFAVADNEKAIYLLDGLKVYRIAVDY